MAHANSSSILDIHSQPEPQCENKRSPLQATRQTRQTPRTPGPSITRINKKGHEERRTAQIKSKLAQVSVPVPLQFLQENRETKLVLCFLVEANGHRCSAPVVGVIEDGDASPAEAAWKTITNQIHIAKPSLKATRHGKPFISKDLFAVGQRCVFYPFGFFINTDLKKNVAPLDLTLVSIPYINRGLRNTFFDAEFGRASGTILAAGLQQLQQDHESGARKLGAVALSILRSILEHLEEPPSLVEGQWWRKARLAAWHLWKNGRPSMDAAIVSFLLLALSEISTALSQEESEGGPKQCVQDALDRVQQIIRSYTARISHHLASYLIESRQLSSPHHHQLQPQPQPQPSKFTILTLSCSSTIRECIIQAALASGAPLVHIHVLESRPLFEGVSMAASIISAFEALSDCPPSRCPQVRVMLFTDASVAQAAVGVDLLLLGADRIAPDGAVSNKTGSLPAALMVRHMAPGAETVVVSEIHKVATGASHDHIVENNEPCEVMDAWDREGSSSTGLDVVQAHLDRETLGAPGRPAVDVQNVYFEWVPATLVDAYICEDGLKTPGDFQRQAQWVSEQSHIYFGI